MGLKNCLNSVDIVAVFQLKEQYFAGGTCYRMKVNDALLVLVGFYTGTVGCHEVHTVGKHCDVVLRIGIGLVQRVHTFGVEIFQIRAGRKNTLCVGATLAAATDKQRGQESRETQNEKNTAFHRINLLS